MSTAKADKQPPKRKVASKPKGPKLQRFVHIDATEKLPVHLTDFEVAQKGMIYARLNNEREAKIAERKSVSDSYKAEISSLTETMEEVGHMLLSREEERIIPTRITFDNKNRTKTVRRRDNRQLVGSVEPMTPAEIKLHAAPPLIEVPPTPKAAEEPVPPASDADLLTTGKDGRVEPAGSHGSPFEPAAEN